MAKIVSISKTNTDSIHFFYQMHNRGAILNYQIYVVDQILLTTMSSLFQNLGKMLYIAQSQGSSQRVLIRGFSGPNVGKYGPEKLRIWILFSQYLPTVSFRKKNEKATIC